MRYGHWNIIRALKGAADETMRFLGDEADVDEVLDKLNIIFWTVSSFDVLMEDVASWSMGFDSASVLLSN